MNRRNFLGRLGAAGAGMALAGTPLARWARAEDANLPRVGFQLGWIKNFQCAGEYVADYRKYYQESGVVADLIAGGPTINVEPIVVAGKALIGQSMPDFMANAINRGAALKCIGATYQRNVSGIMAPAHAPLRTPQDMIGKKIGMQTKNLVIWNAFLKMNRIKPESVHTVPVQFDFTPLISGEVDGFFGQVTDDATQLRAKGFDVACLLFSDFGYKMLAETYMVATDSLADKTKRAQIVAFMKGDVRGWQDAIQDPALGARLTVDIYGKGNGLDFKAQEASCIVTNDFIVSAETKAHGLFWMSPQAVEETCTTLSAAGVKATPDMFTNEILEEVYQGKTTL